MKVKKTITARVLAANKMNAQKSTGPQNTDAVKQNARTHGLLSKNLFFQSDEEKREFEEIFEDLQAEQHASGLLERTLVEETAISIWKLRATDGWDIRELANRRSAAKAVLQSVTENNEDEHLLLNSYAGQAVQRGWDCQENDNTVRLDECCRRRRIDGHSKQQVRADADPGKADDFSRHSNAMPVSDKTGFVPGHRSFARNATGPAGGGMIVSTSRKHYHSSRSAHADRANVSTRQVIRAN